MKYKREIYEVLRELGVLPHTKGYTYVSHIINEFLEGNYDEYTRFMKIYSETAEKFNSEYRRIERNMRYIVDNLPTSAGREVLDKYFGDSVSKGKVKLNNQSFIRCIVEYMKVYVVKD